jgi:hypothetical protein
MTVFGLASDQRSDRPEHPKVPVPDVTSRQLVMSRHHRNLTRQIYWLAASRVLSDNPPLSKSLSQRHK